MSHRSNSGGLRLRRGMFLVAVCRSSAMAKSVCIGPFPLFSPLDLATVANGRDQVKKEHHPGSDNG
jgi:hypothetical protein